MNPPCSSHTRKKKIQGFSLVEMLTTIAVLGVLTSIALLSMSSINQNSLDTRDRRNAQELAMICNTAQAAGVDFVVDGDLEATIKNVVAGGSPTDGAFQGRFFGLKGMAPSDQENAKRFLELNNRLLSYKPQS